MNYQTSVCFLVRWPYSRQVDCSFWWLHFPLIKKSSSSYNNFVCGCVSMMCSDRNLARFDLLSGNARKIGQLRGKRTLPSSTTRRIGHVDVVRRSLVPDLMESSWYRSNMTWICSQPDRAWRTAVWKLSAQSPNSWELDGLPITRTNARPSINRRELPWSFILFRFSLSLLRQNFAQFWDCHSSLVTQLVQASTHISAHCWDQLCIPIHKQWLGVEERFVRLLKLWFCFSLYCSLQLDASYQ